MPFCGVLCLDMLACHCRQQGCLHLFTLAKAVCRNWDLGTQQLLLLVVEQHLSTSWAAGCLYMPVSAPPCCATLLSRVLPQTAVPYSPQARD